MRYSYFDYAATTPIAPEVMSSMEPYFNLRYGNAGSLHYIGSQASDALVIGRESVARFLGAKLSEIYFTSGATESNNIALQGILGSGDHVIISSIEHPSVFAVADFLIKNGVDVSILPVSKDGIIRLDMIDSFIRPTTKLISVMYANNEIGTIQPIKELGKYIKDLNASRIKKIFFHTDATQMVPYYKLDVNDLGVDLISFSAHKMYGPKGIGCLYVRSDINIEPLYAGGGQELGLRPGTENIPGIVGLAASVSFVERERERLPLIQKWRDSLLNFIQQTVPDCVVHGSLENRLVTNGNVSFPGFEAEQLVYLFDKQGIAISSISACSAKALEPSRVIKAIGGSREQSRGSIRFTLGYMTTDEDIYAFQRAMINIFKK